MVLAGFADGAAVAVEAGAAKVGLLGREIAAAAVVAVDISVATVSEVVALTGLAVTTVVLGAVAVLSVTGFVAIAITATETVVIVPAAAVFVRDLLVVQIAAETEGPVVGMSTAMNFYYYSGYSAEIGYFLSVFAVVEAESIPLVAANFDLGSD